MGRRAIPSTTLAAAVRAYFGLTQQELAQWLQTTAGFISHLEAGRSALPPAVFDRLLPLARALPPTPATPVAAPTPAGQPFDPDPLLARLDYCRHYAAKARRAARPYAQAAQAVARWQAAEAELLAALPPDAATARATVAHRAAPLPPADVAAWHLLRLRAEALDHEAAALAALLAANGAADGG